ncbi:phenylalanyl-tRNA synthetase, beta subunit [Plesiocystis pacifica SIR-1]|uniref:Phenylalanine--tRNA ligase beta subunit n=1 Tax=Plesiocystis pacifica SIR-1 TaxID=391625 RepID=A6G4W1_9BACT|nr:phenylalanine--tRNA ligase subunit beta [Plesiocystis pacifica]EDM79053.1 phenylalanyl-tRNA synthetase, beta subunit [Plesiocystis pacifica SIR-1]
MLISCNWLNELLAGAPIVVGPNAGELADGKVSAEAIADTLTSLGLEVEGVTHYSLDGVIVGELRSVEKHPNADKLNLVQLFDGSELIQVVCGASNLPEPGGKVAFAPVGTVLPGDFSIGARKVRGVESFGMICSEVEMDIGADGEGILVLPEDWPAGAKLSDQIPGIVDTVIEIAVTPNRPDALGHMGVAIDLAVALDSSTQTPAHWKGGELPVDAGLVELPAGDRCGRYLGYALEGASVGTSPDWLRVRLHRVGLRAINDAVDITNLVLMETGQPMHAFDRAKLAEGRVVIRQAAAGEPMTTLDETAIELVEDDLVIADASAPQALAGVMGGAQSMVDSGTSTLLLEIAYFEPKGIRRSAKRHGFHTDSSHRFERGVDDDGKLELAARRAVHLFSELCGAKAVAWAEATGERPQPPVIELRASQVEALLGLEIAAEETARILEGLGVHLEAVEGASEPSWRCTPPSFRPDLTRSVDLIEEVMRHHGLERIVAKHNPVRELPTPIPEDPQRTLAEGLAAALRGEGLHEQLSMAFCSEQALEPFTAEVPKARMVRLTNPLRSQLAVMRTHMLPGLLDAATVNRARHDRPVGFCELGRVYAWPEAAVEAGEGPTAEVDARLPRESTRLAVLRGQQVEGPREGGLARQVLGDLLFALEAQGIWAEPRVSGEGVSWLHPGVQAGLWVEDRQVGVAGELHPDLRAGRSLGEASEFELAYGELWLEALADVEVAYADAPRFPSSARDLSLDLSDAISACDAISAIRTAYLARDAGEGDDPVRLASAADASGLRGGLEAREDYRGAGVEDGRHALLLRLHYRAQGRSVTDAEVQALHDAVVESACAALRERDPGLRVR